MPTRPASLARPTARRDRELLADRLERGAHLPEVRGRAYVVHDPAQRAQRLLRRRGRFTARRRSRDDRPLGYCGGRCGGGRRGSGEGSGRVKVGYGGAGGGEDEYPDRLWHVLRAALRAGAIGRAVRRDECARRIVCRIGRVVEAEVRDRDGDRLAAAVRCGHQHARLGAHCSIAALLTVQMLHLQQAALNLRVQLRPQQILEQQLLSIPRLLRLAISRRLALCSHALLRTFLEQPLRLGGCVWRDDDGKDLV